jgi:hypothetical protein
LSIVNNIITVKILTTLLVFDYICKSQSHGRTPALTNGFFKPITKAKKTGFFRASQLVGGLVELIPHLGSET